MPIPYNLKVYRSNRKCFFNQFLLFALISDSKKKVEIPSKLKTQMHNNKNIEYFDD